LEKVGGEKGVRQKAKRGYKMKKLFGIAAISLLVMVT